MKKYLGIIALIIIATFFFNSCAENTNKETKTKVEEKDRTVKVQLSQKDYQIALKAHSDGNWIKITGELIIRDKNAELLNPRDLTIEYYDE